MKKTAKILLTMLLAVMLVSTITGPVFAAEGDEAADETAKATTIDVDGTIDKLMQPKENANTQQVQDLGATIVNIIQVVGIIVAIVVILIIGIKYLTSSAEGKAEYKKMMVPYVVGAFLIFAGSSIVKMIYSLVPKA